jgi:POT family proton-dependent oligopeptide transporter
MSDSTTTITSSFRGPQLCGHPRGLATLFLTETFERFTYYGMRAILVLFMTAAATRGGLGLDDKAASNIYGLYIAGTYLLGLLGGYIADRPIGQQRAVLAGGILIAIGNALLTLGKTQAFFLGLVTIVCGVGLLKPNVSAIVAQLYPQGGSRRDAGFPIFYMGINLGAFFGGLLVPIVTAALGWRAGFALPAVGMVIGLAQFLATRSDLAGAGASLPASAQRTPRWPVVLLIALCALVGAFAGIVHIDPVAVSTAANFAMSALASVFFLYLLFGAGLRGDGRRRVLAGTRQIDVSATIEYRGPLITWRNAQNKNQRCRCG